MLDKMLALPKELTFFYIKIKYGSNKKNRIMKILILTQAIITSANQYKDDLTLSEIKEILLNSGYDHMHRITKINSGSLASELYQFFRPSDPIILYCDDKGQYEQGEIISNYLSVGKGLNTVVHDIIEETNDQKKKTLSFKITYKPTKPEDKEEATEYKLAELEVIGLRQPIWIGTMKSKFGSFFIMCRIDQTII